MTASHVVDNDRVMSCLVSIVNWDEYYEPDERIKDPCRSLLAMQACLIADSLNKKEVSLELFEYNGLKFFKLSTEEKLPSYKWSNYGSQSDIVCNEIVFTLGSMITATNWCSFKSESKGVYINAFSRLYDTIGILPDKDISTIYNILD